MSENQPIGEISYVPVALPEWVELPAERLRGVLKKVNEYIEPVRFDPPPATTGKVRQLPFYKDFYAIELTNLAATPPYSKYALVRPGDVYVIDWTVEPLYEVNRVAPLNLEAGYVVAYLNFFTDFVFTAEGQRFIIENVNDLPWAPDATDIDKARVIEHIEPARLSAAYEDGGFRVEVVDLALYDLYRSTVYVTADGKVDWLIQGKLVENLPIVRRDLLV